MAQYIYTFGKGKAQGNAAMKGLLGGKGANLAEMAKLGLPVPPGFTITTEVCNYFLENDANFPTELESQIDAGLFHIEKIVDRRFGDSKLPLLLSVRSGASVSMPGMMDTILNLGLNDETVEGLIHLTDNSRFGFDSYRRFIQMYSNVVLQIPHEIFEKKIAEVKQREGISEDVDMKAVNFEELCESFKAIVEEHTSLPFPQKVEDQIDGAVRAVFHSWNGKRACEYRRISGIPQTLGTACTVQAMVFGNMGKDCATGVAFTRDPSNGLNEFYGEYLLNAQGEDVVAGIRTPLPINRRAAQFHGMAQEQMPTTLEEQMPKCYKELESVRSKLEKHYRDMQDIEFTVENGKLWVLQTRTGKRTAQAAMRIVVDMVAEKMISKDEALMRITSKNIERLLHPTFIDGEKAEFKLLAKGLSASPGAAVGKVVFSADEAVEWKNKGEKVVLVRIETSPEDFHGMHASEGFLTARGGMTSHAAVVARGMGKPCVAGCSSLQINENSKACIFEDGTIINEGEMISIDGSTGEVMLGAIPVHEPTLDENFQRVMSWADDVRKLRVRANAETERDVAVAVQFGAEGIGLARTEHMFFEPGRIEIVREMILAEDSTMRKKALAKLLPLQKQDMSMILQKMEGFPVTIRLLDPPLHEFLPRTNEEISSISASVGQSVDHIRALISRLHELNPMLGHRGCRLGISYPEIYAMQAQAILEAACELKKTNNVNSIVEIEIPLVGHVNEFRHLRAIVTRVAEEVMNRTEQNVEYSVGAMLELPRACLTADAIAAHADFLSFGTNDLTQTVMGISRDDSGSFLKSYIEHKILPVDPFVTIDRDGVGQMMQIAVDLGRKCKPDITFGICGEHGGDPDSIDFCHGLGLDYVSCSPYRVPVARLAAAQSVLRKRRNTN